MGVRIENTAETLRHDLKLHIFVPIIYDLLRGVQYIYPYLPTSDVQISLHQLITIWQRSFPHAKGLLRHIASRKGNIYVTDSLHSILPLHSACTTRRPTLHIHENVDYIYERLISKFNILINIEMFEKFKLFRPF